VPLQILLRPENFLIKIAYIIKTEVLTAKKCFAPPKPLDLATGLAQANAQWGNRNKV